MISMKKVFHKTASILMALVVLFSTMSFTIDMHYCGGTIVDTAVFHKVKTCGMEMQPSTENKDCSIAKTNCCSDKQIIVDGQDELQLSFDDRSSFKQQQLISSFIYKYINILEGEEDTNSYREYSLPLLVRQIYKLDETYLI